MSICGSWVIFECDAIMMHLIKCANVVNSSLVSANLNKFPLRYSLFSEDMASNEISQHFDRSFREPMLVINDYYVHSLRYNHRVQSK